MSADDYCLKSLQNRSCASHNECGVSRTCASEQRARSEFKVDILHQLFWCESKTLARVSQQATELRALTSRMILRWEFAYLGMVSSLILLFEHELHLLILTKLANFDQPLDPAQFNWWKFKGVMSHFDFFADGRGWRMKSMKW